MDLGFTEGSIVKTVRKSPLGDPTAYLIRGSIIALRQEEAAQINTDFCTCPVHKPLLNANLRRDCCGTDLSVGLGLYANL